MQLFVYGSLRKGFHHPAYQYISAQFDFVSDARVNGLLYDLGEYPGAISSGSGEWIVGELYRLKPDADWDWAIAQLDDYEGVADQEGDPALFHREITRVYLPDASQEEAYVYWYLGDIKGKPLVAGGDMLHYHHHKG